MRALKKKPIQIYIEPKQEMLLKSLAQKKRTSKAAIIRLSIDNYLSKLPVEEDPALGIIGLGKSGKGDISKKHDTYLVHYTSDYTNTTHSISDGFPSKKKKA
ncbi:MAG: CopG family transcriptional regulator [Nitrospira sp.]|nr:CopG family transcriptional regulator [Nitrospira sp.]